jgi:hypothetical protein
MLALLNSQRTSGKGQRMILDPSDHPQTTSQSAMMIYPEIVAR